MRSKHTGVSQCLLIIIVSLLLSACSWFPSPQEAPYRLIQTWGEKGSKPGQFNEPTGITSTQTEIFVSDARNNRIQVFDHYGKYKRSFQLSGNNNGEPGRPMNLTVFDNKIFIADYWNNQIQLFTLTGKYLRSISGKPANTKPSSAPGSFHSPAGVAVSADGNIYVADFYNHRIQMLSKQGEFIRQWGDTGLTGSKAEQFSYPTAVAIANDGKLYVADGYNDRIQVFNAEGSFSHKWGGPLAMNIHGSFNGWFATVTSIAIGPKGNIFVADFYNDRIQKFDPSGQFLNTFGVEGNGINHTAMAVTVTYNGNVFVTDIANHQIQKWSPQAY